MLMLCLRETNHKKENIKGMQKPDLHVILIYLMRCTAVSAVYSLSETQKAEYMCIFFHPGGILNAINSTISQASTELLSQNLPQCRFLHPTTTTAQWNVSNERFQPNLCHTLTPASPAF